MTHQDIFQPRRPVPRAIYDALQKAQEGRNRNPNWQQDELAEIWRETNHQRALLGKGPVSIKDVEAKERHAVGHIDYAMKVAYYCEELVNQP